jgi:glycosyltransferase involved in cell wall biosynthesis
MKNPNVHMKKNKKIVMLGTSMNANGGIATVIGIYSDAGLFADSNICYLPTHCSGTITEKIAIAARTTYKFILLLLRDEVELVHIHTATGISFWRKTFFLNLAFLFKVKTILHIHSGHFPEFYSSQRSKINKACIRRILAKVQKIIVVSTSLAQVIRAITERDDISVVHNPIRFADQNEDGRTENTILFLGHLQGKKGIDDLIYAMEKVSQAVPDAKLMLCGDGDLQHANELLAALNLREYVDVTGWLESDEKMALLRRAAVYVLPSYAEGMPMSILEAMAVGLPTIATTVGGIPEAITHQKEGLLYEAGDRETLAQYLIFLLEAPMQRKKMGIAARQRAQSEFSVAKSITQLNQIYATLIGHKPTRERVIR